VSRLFGTDGVRGVANRELTPELAYRLGRATASLLPETVERASVVIGRDTRLSGSMLEAAIVAGITSVGRDTISLGVVPTPAVAAVAKRTSAAAGVVISASHNPIEDNGIKLFGSDGFKFADAFEDEIEELIDAADLPRPTGAGVGRARVAQNLTRHYYEELYARAGDLTGLTAIVDAACGAAYAIAPYALRKLGATVIEINCEDDGARINVGGGATDLRPLQATVRATIAEGKGRVVGVAFDGDADRALFVDETGSVVSGDHVMFALACDLRERGELPGDAVVATVMSNIGFERALQHHGIGLVRAAVGDRYVLEKMREGGYALGGEQSGHVVDFRFNTTGDGPRTAVTLLSLMMERGTTLHELISEIVVAPQVLLNVRTVRRDVLDSPALREEIAAAEMRLAGTGRLLIRRSGTEPLIRVMAEGDDRSTIEAVAARVAGRIEQEAERLAKSESSSGELDGPGRARQRDAEAPAHRSSLEGSQ
jgi:phosphoglucosamine mutase